MNWSLLLSIPAFSLGSFGSLAAHSVFWLGLCCVLLVSGMGFVKLYGETLSELIASRATWFQRFAVSGSIRRFLRTSTTSARIWTADEEKECMQRQGLIPTDEDIPGRAMGARLKSLEDDQKKRMQGLARIWGVLSVGLLVVSWAGGTMLALHDHHKIAGLEAQIRQYQKERTRPEVIDRSPTEVLERIDKKSFRGRYNNPNTGELIAFTVTSCPGHPDPTDEIQAGVTLPVLEWVEDTEHHCMILDGWGGYTLLRNGVNPILTAFKEN